MMDSAALSAQRLCWTVLVMLHMGCLSSAFLMHGPGPSIPGSLLRRAALCCAPRQRIARRLRSELGTGGGSRLRMQAEEEGDWSLLHVVAWDGDLDKARALLEVGHPVDPQLSTGHTPLHIAAQGGNTELARLLLDQGQAEADARTVQGITPLYLALQNRQLDVAQLLVDRGASVDAQTVTGNSALHMAAQKGFLEEALLLLQSGCNVDARTVTGHTPLHLAATYGQHDMAEVLLVRGHASVDAEDNTGRRPLHFAAQTGAHDTVVLLLAHASSVDAPSSRGLTPLDVAAYAAPPRGRPDSLDSVRALLGAGASVSSVHPWNGQTALHAGTIPASLLNAETVSWQYGGALT
jgi:ankyrin repeat protein